jgi:hypothetical protein
VTVYTGPVSAAATRGTGLLATPVAWLSAVACGDHETRSPVTPPGAPESARTKVLEAGAPPLCRVVRTYGKTWYTWHTDLHRELPLGVPQLMMGFTADGQADPATVAARDKRFDVDSAAKRRQREDIATPAIDAGADAWQRGRVLQLPDPTGTPHGTAGHGTAP